MSRDVLDTFPDATRGGHEVGLIVARVERMPTAAEMFGRPLEPAPWPTSRPVINLGIEMLQTVENDLTADLVEALLLAVINQAEELAAVRMVLAAALEHAHGLQAENVRLQKRLVGLLDERRIAA